MAILKKDEFIAKISNLIGEDNSDENLQLLEDVADTFDSWGENDTWKEKYEENDNAWRKKYRERFEQPSTKESEEEQEEHEEQEKTTFEDLFKAE